MECLYIYIRVSTQSQVDKGASLEGQERKGREMAERLKLKPIIFKDAGISASKEDFLNRPSLFRLLESVKEGKVKHLWVFDITRLSRNPVGKAKIEQVLKENKVKLYEGNTVYDLDSDTNLLMYRIMSGMSEYEAALRIARFKNGALEKRRQGCFLGPIPPYGYRKDKNKKLVINEDEAEVFRNIVDMYLNKDMGSGQIANALNSKRILTKTQIELSSGYKLEKGKANRKMSKKIKENLWNPGTIISMFKNTVYKGALQFKNDEDQIEEVECPAIISKETWSQIHLKMKSNRVNKVKEDKYFYLLKGKLKCGCCGSNMHGRIKLNRKEFTYRCAEKRADYTKENRCTARGINIFKLNDLIWDTFALHNEFKYAIYESQKESNISQKMTEINAEIKIKLQKISDLESYIERGVKLVIEGLITKTEYSKNKLEYDSEIKILMEEVNQLESAKNAYLRKDELNQEINDFLELVIRTLKWRQEYSKVRKIYDEPKNPRLLALREIIQSDWLEEIVVTWIPEQKKHKVEIKFMLGETVAKELDLSHSIPTKTKQPTRIVKLSDYATNKYPSLSQSNGCSTCRRR